MKTNNLFNPGHAIRSVLLAVLTLIGSGATQAANFFDNAIVVTGTGGGVIDLNTAGGGNGAGRYCWAIFALQGGVTITDPSYTGIPDVIGNVGVAQGGTINMSNSVVSGTVYLRDFGVPTVPPPATVSGGVLLNQNAILNPAQTFAYNAASTAAGLSRTIGTMTNANITGAVPNTILTNDTTTISLANTPGAINGVAGETYVLNLANLVLSGASAVLTLNGSATTNYVINVSKYLSLSAGSKIVLSGGLQPQNVLFNVRNTYGYDVTLSGGSTLDGIILASNRNVKLTGASVVTGEVIARAVSLSGNSRVINPVCSP
jgi:hypothetical protein